MYPELSWKEDKTLAFIKSEIQQLLLNYSGSYTLIEKRSGIILDLNICPEFDRILFRADVDALPIHEETGLSFASKVPGVMHACGHDAHAAMLLGALKCITTNELEIKHNLRFVFQRAEEITNTMSGGECMVKEGALKNISKAYAIHISSRDEKNTMKCRSGYMMSNAASVSFEIKCRGGHVKDPNNGSNAVDVLTDIHVHLRGFALRNIGPKESVSFIPTISVTGERSNIMPEIARSTYSFRNFISTERRNLFFKELKQRIKLICSTYPDTSLVSFEVCPGFPPLVNDPDNHKYVNNLLVNNGFDTAEARRSFAGEDFSYFLNKCEGSYWVLGAKQGKGYGHHTSLFNPSEEVFQTGAAFWLLLAISD